MLHRTTSKRRLFVTYASGTANCGGPPRVGASGSRSRGSGGLNKNARLTACGPTGRPSRTLVPLRPEDREWKAFQEVFLVSRPRFVSMAYTISRNKEDAENAVQDVVLSAYVHLRAFEGRSALTMWFSRIVLNAPRRIAFSGLSRTHSSPVSGTPNAND
jgi:hypothetical protein